MQTNILPAGTCEKIDRIVRNFIWGSTLEKRKMHLVGWSKVCQENGGLGLRFAKVNNEALILKLAWGLLTDKGALWASILKQKYSLEDLVPWELPRKNGASPVWRGLCKAWPKLRASLRWVLGNGCRANFWYDWWIPDIGPLHCYVLCDIPNDHINLSVAKFVDFSSNWKWEMINSLLLATVCLRIAKIPTPNPTKGDDKVLWGFTPNGLFSIKSAISFLQESIEGRSEYRIWKALWNWKGPQRLKSFLWVIMQGRLPTNELCFNRQVLNSPICPRCGSQAESQIHVLRDCDFAKLTWLQLVTEEDWPGFFTLSIKEWIVKNIRKEGTHNMDGKPPWTVTFVVTMWSLWSWRNEYVFGSEGTSTQQSIYSIMLKSSEIWFAFCAGSRFEMLGSKKYSGWCSWLPPKEGWVKLNCDGSVDASRSCAAVGGLIRDEKGQWIAGFLQLIGHKDIIQTEITSILIGLKLAKQMGCSTVLVESDSQSAVDIINQNVASLSSNMPMIVEVVRMLKMFLQYQVSHVFRESNQCADWLARRGLFLDPGFHSFSSLPPEISLIFNRDALGISYFRSS